MKYLPVLIAPVFAGFVFLTSCDKTANAPEVEFAEHVVKYGERIFIIDRTNKKWDVTHAVNKYRMDPNRFQFGLGQYAISAICDTKMLSPGDAGYPKDEDNDVILGTTLNGDIRAYPLSVMISHEVLNDQFRGPEEFAATHAIVAY